MLSPLNTFAKRVDDFVYTHAIQLFGGGADAYANLAARYESLGWWEEAAQSLQKCIPLRPQHPDYQLKLVQALVRLERFPEAFALTQNIIQSHPQLAPAYVLQGILLLKSREPLKAFDCFRTAMTLPLNDAGAYSTMAKAFAEAELYEDAVHAYKEIIRISPRNVAAYGVMAETYAKLNRYPEALEAYRKAVELKPTADGYGILASAYARVGQYREAVNAFQKAMKCEPGFSQTWNRLSEIYIKLEDFEKRTSAGPTDEGTKKAFAKLRQEQEALENFKEMIRERPHDPGAYLKMGQLYLDIHLPNKALDFLKHALRLKATGATIHRSLGQAYMGIGKTSEARNAFQNALRAQKNDAETWSALGQFHLQQNEPEEAIKAFKEAMRWKPQEGSLHRHVGDIYRRLGRNQEASRAYWQAIHLNPQDGAARFGLGVAYVRLNQRSYAMEQKAVLKTVDAKLAAELDHVIWRLERTPKS